MSRLTARVRIVRMPGGKYKIDKIKVREDHGDRTDVSKAPIIEQPEFPTKNEAREHGALLAHAYITSKYGEGARYQTEWKMRVMIPQKVAEKPVGQ